MEITVWQNKENRCKFIILKKYECNHYSWAQIMRTIPELPIGKPVNCVFVNRRRFQRVSCAVWRDVLEKDYEKIHTIAEGGDEDAEIEEL